MRVFLLDLWLDLREKRLAPVALLLLGAIVVIPIALAKGRKAQPAPATTTTTAAAPAAPVIQSQPQAGPVESKLQTFSPRDPFEPTVRIATAGGGGGGGGGTTSTGGGTSTSTTTTTTGGGGGATTGVGPTTGTGTPTTGTPPTGTTTPQTKTTLFTYTVDLRFGTSGVTKTYKDVKRLDLIPSEKNPKIDFLGVTTTGKTAVFLVSSDIGVDTSGGKCRPSADNCTFLYLRPDGDHDLATLTDADGTVYHMRLLAIHRVTVSSSNGTTNNGTTNGNSNTGTTRSPAFTGSAGRDSSASSDSTDVPAGETPPGEPDKRSSFDQMFADSSGPSK